MSDKNRAFYLRINDYYEYNTYKIFLKEEKNMLQLKNIKKDYVQKGQEPVHALKGISL